MYACCGAVVRGYVNIYSTTEEQSRENSRKPNLFKRHRLDAQRRIS